MTILYSTGPSQTTVINLDQNAFLRIVVGAATIGSASALAINALYPPGEYHNQLSLLKVPVGVASDIEEVRRLSNSALIMGNKEDDIKRLTEGYELFKNNARAPSQAALEEAIKQGVSLVEAYWKLRMWITNPEKARLTIELDNQTLIGEP